MENKKRLNILKTKVMPTVIGASLTLSSAAITGCSKDPNAPKPTKTAIVVNDDTAMLIEVAYFYDEPVSKMSDKVEYTFHLRRDDDNGYPGSNSYIQVYDDDKTDVIVIDDYNSFEKAKALAYTLVGDEGTIYLYEEDGITPIDVKDSKILTDENNTNSYTK